MDEMRWICVSDASIVDSSIEWEIQYYNVIKHVRIAISSPFALGRTAVECKILDMTRDSLHMDYILLVGLSSYCVLHQTSFIRHSSFKYASNAPNETDAGKLLVQLSWNMQ